MTDKPQVVVVGAGFGGISATRRLARAGFRVTLIDRHPYNTFQPLLYQVATGGLNPGDVTYSLRFFSARYHARFRRATVTGIDRDKRQVLCDDGVQVDYDYLIIGIGTTTNHFGIPGAAEYSMSMYTRAEALSVRDTIFGGLETIAGRSDPGTGGFTVVIVGGGATGVEMAGTLAEMRSQLPATFPELDPAKVNVVLVEMGDHLLPPFDDRLRRYALRQLLKRGVDVRLKTALSRVYPDKVEFADGTSMAVDLVIWAAGVAGHGEVSDWGLPTGRGNRIEIERDTRVKGEDRIFSIGDAGVITDDPVPMLAQPAIQMGSHAAEQIIRLERGQPTVPFKYKDKGMLATIGNRAAVAELLGGVKFTGTPAWLLWIGVHIVTLLGGRNRVQTMVNLASRYAPWKQKFVIVGDVEQTPAMKSLASEAESSTPSAH